MLALSSPVPSRFVKNVKISNTSVAFGNTFSTSKINLCILIYESFGLFLKINLFNGHSFKLVTHLETRFLLLNNNVNKWVDSLARSVSFQIADILWTTWFGFHHLPPLIPEFSYLL